MKILIAGLLVIAGSLVVTSDHVQASVLGEAECEVTLKVEQQGGYSVTNISAVSSSMTFASCKQRYKERAGLSIGDKLTVDQTIHADIDGVVDAGTDQVRIPISFTSAMGVGGAVSGVHYHTDAATQIVASQQMGIESEDEVDVAVQGEAEITKNAEDNAKPTVADGQPPTTYRDSVLYGWWHRIISWFGW